MSNRDDSVLYTGLTSASARKTAEQRAERKRESKTESLQLAPAEEKLITLIQKERDTVCDIRSFVMSADTPEDDIKAQLLARKLHEDFLSRFQASVQLILRVPESKAEEVTS